MLEGTLAMPHLLDASCTLLIPLVHTHTTRQERHGMHGRRSDGHGGAAQAGRRLEPWQRFPRPVRACHALERALLQCMEHSHAHAALRFTAQSVYRMCRWAVSKALACQERRRTSPSSSRRPGHHHQHQPPQKTHCRRLSVRPSQLHARRLHPCLIPAPIPCMPVAHRHELRLGSGAV